MVLLYTTKTRINLRRTIPSKSPVHGWNDLISSSFGTARSTTSFATTLSLGVDSSCAGDTDSAGAVSFPRSLQAAAIRARIKTIFVVCLIIHLDENANLRTTAILFQTAPPAQRKQSQRCETWNHSFLRLRSPYWDLKTERGPDFGPV